MLDEKVRQLEEELRLAREDSKFHKDTNMFLRETVKNQMQENTRLLQKVQKLLKKKFRSSADDENETAHQDYEKLLVEMKADFTKKLEEQELKYRNELGKMKEELDAYKKEADGQIAEIKAKGTETEKETLAVCNECGSLLPKTLRIDGVSVACSSCRYCNIVVSAKEGFKWISIKNPTDTTRWCQHFQQAPVDTKQGLHMKCSICELEGPCFNCNVNYAHYLTVAEFAQNLANRKHSELIEAVEMNKTEIVEKSSQFEAFVIEKMESVSSRLSEMENKQIHVSELQKDTVNQLENILSKMTTEEPTPRCSKCRAELPKDMTRADGVGILCNCNRVSIVGELKEGHKWISIDMPSAKSGWCKHYSQIPMDVPFGQVVKCQFCDNEGACHGAYGNIAPLMTAAEVKKEAQSMKLDEMKKFITDCVYRVSMVKKDANACNFM